VSMMMIRAVMTMMAAPQVWSSGASFVSGVSDALGFTSDATEPDEPFWYVIALTPAI